MSYVLLVGLGGALGAISRYVIDDFTASKFDSAVLGTLIVNVSGSFILGLFVGLLSVHSTWSIETKMFLAVGFLGSYTTFSSLSVATIQFVSRGELHNAVLNLGASILLGLGAAVVGIMLGKML